MQIYMELPFRGGAKLKGLTTLSISISVLWWASNPDLKFFMNSVCVQKVPEHHLLLSEYYLKKYKK